MIWVGSRLSSLLATDGTAAQPLLDSEEQVETAPQRELTHRVTPPR